MNETLKTIHSLRTVHGDFSNQEISSDDLESILSAAVRTANSSARQCYSIVVIEDHEAMRDICGCAGSKVLIFCVDYTRLVDLADALGYEYHAEGLGWFTTGSTDAILAAQTAAIAAKSLGIDSLFTNGIHRGDIDRIYRLLDLPEKHCFPLIALVLGYPKQEPTHRTGRLCGPGLVHHGTYHRLTPEETEVMIAEYDDSNKGLGLACWNREEYGHYLDWFFESWSACPRKGDAMAVSARNRAPQMPELLARAGFLPMKEQD